jgi:predicted ATPase
MDDFVTSDTLHRGAKYFMDSGLASTHSEAMHLLHQFGLHIMAGPELTTSRNHQIALLTLVNAARRTFLGGVEVSGVTRGPLLAPLADADRLDLGIEALGGRLVSHNRMN